MALIEALGSLLPSSWKENASTTTNPALASWGLAALVVAVTIYLLTVMAKKKTGDVTSGGTRRGRSFSFTSTGTQMLRCSEENWIRTEIVSYYIR